MVANAVGVVAVHGWPLRRRLTVLLLLAAVVPMLAVGALAALALRGVISAGAGQGAVALAARAKSDFAVSAHHAATLQSQDFLQVQARVAALASSAQYLFEHPAQFPGTQQGNSPLLQGKGGAWLSQTGAPVGVFVPAGTDTSPAFWDEVNLVSHLDPFIETLQASASSPALVRLWLITPEGMVRAVPDPGYGHPGSAVAPGANLAREPFYLDAANAKAATAVWTPAPYPDPAGGPADIETVSVAVRDAAGHVIAVVGADVSVPVMASALGQGLNAAHVGLLTEAGRWVAGDPASQAYFAQRTVLGAAQAAAQGQQGPVASGADLVAAAAVHPPGWMLVAAAPTANVLGAATGLEAAVQAERDIELTALLGALVVAALAALTAAMVARRTTRPLEQLAARIRATGGEGAAGPAAPRAQQDDEVQVVVGEFDAMRARLREAASRVEEAALHRARAEQAAELARLEDRNALAREVHDTLAQGFVAAQMLAEAAGADAAAGDWAAVERRVGRIADVAREGLGQARASVRDLMPAPDLAAMLRQEAGRIRIPVDVQVEGEPGRLPAPVRAALAAIAREALTNVDRHARAASARLTLTCGDGAARLEIADDGGGIRPEGTGDDLRGFGLSSMEARAAAVGGRLRVESVEGGGTRVTAEVPLRV